MIIVWSGLALCCYRHVLGDLFHQWQTNTSYSHGAIVIPVAIWILWRRRSTLPEASQPWMAGMGLLLAAHFLLWLGGYFYLPAIQRWTIPLWLSGMTALLWGRRVLVWSLPGVCFLAFMIPLPFQLEMLANQYLQWASAWCSCFFLGVSSTFAVTDGYTLRMSTGQVGITADCSGLRMTVAIAALVYVITFLNQEPFRRDRRSGMRLLGRASYLSMMMLMVIPAAIVANAARITVMALVMHRYQMESYTAWIHDLGDWLVLPVSAALFIVLRAWLDSVLRMWRAAVHIGRSNRDGSNTPRRWIASISPVWRIAVGPVALAVLAAASFWHYDSQRERIVAKMMIAARSHEERNDWARAAACYRELAYLQSSPEESRYRYACVLRQAAESFDDRKQAFFQLEALLERAPLHLAAMRTHLDMAIELNMAAAALRSAERLYAIDRYDATSLQLCVEAILRFPANSSALPAISTESFAELFEKLGPVTGWRDSLVIEVAGFCCGHPDSADSRLTSAVGSAIQEAASRVGSAKAHFTLWDFERVFGRGAASLEPALLCIDDECPKHVAYKIYLASAEKARLGEKPDDAKQLLKKAIGLSPTDHRGYALLGDVFASQKEWLECTAAYLRAWRLAGDHPLELGVKLAESLIRIERHSVSTNLVKMLAEDVEFADITPSRNLRMRLQLVQARLDIHAAKYDEACQKLERCALLATWNRLPSAAPDELLPTIESLQAQCLVRLGKYADAARWFEDRAGQVDSPADQWTAAARAWRTAGNASAAARCYRKAIAALGYSSEVWLEYIHLLKETRGIDVAVSEIALRHGRVQQGPPIADEVLAQAWEIVGDSDRAIQFYRSAATRDVRNVAALAIALARQGEVDRAVELIADEHWSVGIPFRAHTAAMVGVTAANLTTASKATIMRIVEDGTTAASDDVTLLLVAVEWYTKCQATSAAIEMLHRAVTVQPDNVIAANNLAMMLADEGRDCEQALGYIDNVLRQTGPVSEFLDTKGWILVQMNRAEEALVWLTEAAERSTSADPIAQLHLATAYLAIGDRDQAREHLEMARASQIRPELLNSSEQRAWDILQKEFRQQALAQRGNDA